MNVKTVFNTAATEYDALRRKFIPGFDDFYTIAVDIIPGNRDSHLKILDLGAGTGLYSSMVQAAFPNAELTLLDFAEEMLAQAPSRFAQMGKSPTILIGDYTTIELGRDYDVIISALSIHHLSHPQQQRLYQRIFRALKPGGFFVNAEQILGKTPQIEQYYQQRWLEAVKAAGISDAQLEAAQNRRQFDCSAPLDDQLSWLEKAGFHNINCWYQRYCFAVFGGFRPETKLKAPTLHSDRVLLRAFTLNDATVVQSLAGDRAVAEMTLAIPHPYTDGEAEAWIQSQHNTAEQEVVWAITLRDSQRLIGAIGLIFDSANHQAELGYWIGKPDWGNGYCTEAARLVLQYGFDQLGLNRIESCHYAKNPASGRVLQKIGMKYEGARRQNRLKWGKYEDLVLYGLLKTDWLRLTPPSYP
jgi:tRNA (cmo5U34)-methyltransferase